MSVAILILAAGASSRMQGEDKLLCAAPDVPLLAQTVGRAMATGCDTYVTLPALNHPRTALIGDAVPVIVRDADQGMSASLRAGVAAIGDHTGVMILPADMPDLTTNDLLTCLNAYDDRIVQATTSDGTKGHPVIFPRRHFNDLLTLMGDRGAKVILNKADPTLVLLPANHAVTDLDTPEAWASWLTTAR